MDKNTNTAYATVFYDEEYTGTATIAVYDANGKLIGIETSAISEDYAVLFTKYSGIAANVKVFVWDDQTYKPMVSEKNLLIG